jgi:copper(I)-binding protein
MVKPIRHVEARAMHFRHLGILALFAFALPGLAHAENYKQGNIEVESPWSRSTPEGAHIGAAYFTLKNNGKEADTLTALQSEAAERAEIHEHINDNGVMKMRAVKGGVAIPPGGTVTFKPGGYHVMLMGLKQKLNEGASFPLKLTFAKAGDVTVEVKVQNTPPQQAVSHEGMQMEPNH